MPDICREEGRLVVREDNDPFPEVVGKTRLSCRLEASFYEELFDRHIECVSYVPDGPPACIYAFPGTEGPEAPDAGDETLTRRGQNVAL